MPRVSGPSSSTILPAPTQSSLLSNSSYPQNQSQSSIQVNLDSSLIQPLDRSDEKGISTSTSALNHMYSASKGAAKSHVKDPRAVPPGVLESKDSDPPSSEFDVPSDEEDEGRIIEVQNQNRRQMNIQTQFQNQNQAQPQQFFTPNGPVQAAPGHQLIHVHGPGQAQLVPVPMQHTHAHHAQMAEDDDVDGEEEGDSGSYYSDESSSEDESPRENRVLTFADEHGQDLCYFCYYEVEVPHEEEEEPEPVRRPQQQTRTADQPQSCMGKCVIS